MSGRLMLLPFNWQYPFYMETHLENDWCEKAGCRPASGRELTEKLMANEGSTKPTYSELEAENFRVRGLLQRLVGAVKELEGTPIEYRLAMELANILKEVVTV